MNGFRNLRVGAIGARPTAFNTVRYSEKILEANRISIETLDLSEVLGRIDRMKDNDDPRRRSWRRSRNMSTRKTCPTTALMKMAKLGAVIDHWMAATEVTISAVQCWTSLEENFGVVPCTVMSMMSDQLFSSACEVDIAGVLGMHACNWRREHPRRCLTGTTITAAIRTRRSASTARTCRSISSVMSRWISRKSLRVRWAKKIRMAPWSD